MKTIFGYFGCTFLLGLAFLLPFNVHAHESKMGNRLDQSKIIFDNFENEYPPSYAARIKRFYHAEEGIGYFDPRYSNEAMPILTQKSKSNKQLVSPFEFKNFQHWASLLNSPIIWRYNNDENYRKIIDKWNHINNPFWSYGITLSCPFGTFDFTGGLGANDINPSVIIADGSINYFSYYNTQRNRSYFSNSVKPNPFTFTSKRKLDNQSKQPTISITKLPIRAPNQRVVNHQTVKNPNFRKHLPVAIIWNRGRGTNTSYKRESNLSQWKQDNEKMSRTGYNSLNDKSGFSENYQNTTNVNQQYNTLSSSNKSNTLSTNSSSNNSSQNHGQTASKKSTASSSNNN